MVHAAVRRWAVVPAAGVGRRMGADRPKQYLPLLGRTVIEHALSCFAQHPGISGIVVAIAPHDVHWEKLAFRPPKPCFTVVGGDERGRTVLNALRFLVNHAAPSDWALVHDAARPCLTRADLDKLMTQVQDSPVGGILATPVRDTMKQADKDKRIVKTVCRRGLWHALTPQMFRIGLLREALERALGEGVAVTDEASAVEHLGHRPQLVEGRADNLKVTLATDLGLAEFFLKHRQDVCGQAQR